MGERVWGGSWQGTNGTRQSYGAEEGKNYILRQEGEGVAYKDSPLSSYFDVLCNESEAIQQLDTPNPFGWGWLEKDPGLVGLE